MDARLTTNLRYFSRDVDDDGHFTSEDGSTKAQTTTAARPTSPFDPPASPDLGDLEEGINSKGSGVGGWNELSRCRRCRGDSLREAAGIKIPTAGFVIFVLAIYLAVLVPLNWGIFRVVGRIELAWIAAPLIAAAGALSVSSWRNSTSALRSKTEISVLEVYGDYPRADLTRYTAPYASLGTTYDLVFEDKNALAVPFPADADFQRVRGQASVESSIIATNRAPGLLALLLNRIRPAWFTASKCMILAVH